MNNAGHIYTLAGGIESFREHTNSIVFQQFLDDNSPVQSGVYRDRIYHEHSPLEDSVPYYSKCRALSSSKWWFRVCLLSRIHELQLQWSVGVEMYVQLGKGDNDSRLPEQLVNAEAEVAFYDPAFHDPGHAQPEIDIKDERVIPEVAEKHKSSGALRTFLRSLAASSMRRSTSCTGDPYRLLSSLRGGHFSPFEGFSASSER
jgi:hypothetical protein